jgi:flavin-dependent thymidylate synthase
MKVELLSYTPNADKLLIFSKKTRLNMSPDSFQEVLNSSDEKVCEELEYVFGTIGSSWEFVDYTFLVSGVGRGYTHEQVRTRQASYAQQSMRAVSMEGFDFVSSGKCKKDARESEVHNPVSEFYDYAMNCIDGFYRHLIALGAEIQDARGVLPTNICTNIMVKINLRSLSNLMNDRLCFRASGEYQEVAKEMKRIVLAVHPWAKPVLQVNCVQYGFCKFKNFKDCPMKTKGFIKDCDSEMLEKEWSKIDLVVQPKVKK